MRGPGAAGVSGSDNGEGHVKTGTKAMAGAAFCALVATAAAAAQDQGTPPALKPQADKWLVSTGLTYSSGDYGEAEKTSVFSMPFSVKYRWGAFSLRIAVPYVTVDGPGSLIQTPEGRDGGFNDFDDRGGGSDDGAGQDDSGGGSSGGNSGSGGGDDNSGSGSGGSGSGHSGGSDDSGGGSDDGGGSGGSGSGTGTGGDVENQPSAADTSRSGFGDINVTALYSFDLGASFYLDMSAKLKIPTASVSERLGTGLIDVTVGAELVKELGDVTLYAGARHRFNGSDARNDLRDVWGAGAGISYYADSDWSFGLDYNWQQSSFAGNGASSEVTAWAAVQLTDDVRMVAYAGTGLTASSADIDAGLSFGWQF